MDKVLTILNGDYQINPYSILVFTDNINIFNQKTEKLETTFDDFHFNSSMNGIVLPLNSNEVLIRPKSEKGLLLFNFQNGERKEILEDYKIITFIPISSSQIAFIASGPLDRLILWDVKDNKEIVKLDSIGKRKFELKLLYHHQTQILLLFYEGGINGYDITTSRLKFCIDFKADIKELGIFPTEEIKFYVMHTTNFLTIYQVPNGEIIFDRKLIEIQNILVDDTRKILILPDQKLAIAKVQLSMPFTVITVTIYEVDSFGRYSLFYKSKEFDYDYPKGLELIPNTSKLLLACEDVIIIIDYVKKTSKILIMDDLIFNLIILPGSTREEVKVLKCVLERKLKDNLPSDLIGDLFTFFTLDKSNKRIT